MTSDECIARLEELLETQVDIDDPWAVHHHVSSVMDVARDIYRHYLEAKYPSACAFVWGDAEPLLQPSDLQRLKRRPGRPRVIHEPTLSDGSRVMSAVRREIDLFTE